MLAYVMELVVTPTLRNAALSRVAQVSLEMVLNLTTTYADEFPFEVLPSSVCLPMRTCVCVRVCVHKREREGGESERERERYVRVCNHSLPTPTPRRRRSGRARAWARHIVSTGESPAALTFMTTLLQTYTVTPSRVTFSSLRQAGQSG